MKKLALPSEGDEDILKDLAKNKKLLSHKEISRMETQLIEQYRKYVQSEGDPWHVGPALAITQDLADYLKGHYTQPPKRLAFLKRLRDKKSPIVCSMCGSLMTGTLDHYLPKDAHPEFAIFSANLVPACLCNTKRGMAYKGAKAGTRAFHPYFDACLKQRLFIVHFSGDLDCPEAKIKVEGLSNLTLAQRRVAGFHIKSVLAQTSLLNWASDIWAALLREPAKILELRSDKNVTAKAVSKALQGKLGSFDATHGTPNNWYSMVYAGLLQSAGVPQYLATRANGIRQGSIVPD